MAKRYKKDPDLDAKLVHAAMKGRFELCAISLGMTTSEAFGRAEWLKKQSRQYIHSVETRIAGLEQKGIMDNLK